MKNLYSYLIGDREVKVFISWSGEKSKAVAKLLKTWISDTIQAIEPWFSEEDIERGAIWFTEISKSLHEVSASIICLTNENKNKSWILFEAGALSGGKDDNRVCTFLIDLDSSNVQQPLAQFNHTFPTKESVLSLLKTLNSKLETGRLEPEQLNRIFKKNWPDFESEFNKILAQYNDEKTPIEKTHQDIMLDEILNAVHNIENKPDRELRQAINKVSAALGSF